MEISIVWGADVAYISISLTTRLGGG
jgi:hypothetical protein